MAHHLHLVGGVREHRHDQPADVGYAFGDDFVGVAGEELPSRRNNCSCLIKIKAISVLMTVGSNSKPWRDKIIFDVFGPYLVRKRANAGTPSPRTSTNTAMMSAINSDSVYVQGEFPPTPSVSFRFPLGPKSSPKCFLVRCGRPDMSFRATNDEDAFRLERERDFEGFFEDIALGFQVPRQDLCGGVVVAFHRIAVRDHIEVSLLFLPFRFYPLPVVTPELPEPSLGLRGGVVAALVQSDSRGTWGKHGPGM